MVDSDEIGNIGVGGMCFGDGGACCRRRSPEEEEQRKCKGARELHAREQPKARQLKLISVGVATTNLAHEKASQWLHKRNGRGIRRSSAPR